jgi:hypothetical protein
MKPIRLPARFSGASYSVFDMLAGESPASAMDGCPRMTALPDLKLHAPGNARMHKRATLALTALLLAPLGALCAAEVPPGDGQITRKVEFFADPHPPANDPARQFAGQKTATGKLVLTASNGFWDSGSGCKASGEAAVKDAAPESFIVPNFESIEDWSQPGKSLRWHLWIENPGPLFANTHLAVAAADAGSTLSFALAGTTNSLVTRAETNPAQPQGASLAFNIATPGWHTLVIRLDKLAGRQTGQLHRIELFGPAAKDASLLRARWRPLACHARFSSSTVEDPILWVMTTRPTPAAAVSSYSPVTTPFGYYGCTYDADGTSSGSANFSMWSYGRGKPSPQEQWSHLIAVGSLEADFGSFGHEGSGVKLRGDWKPFAGLKEVTVALRREAAPPFTRYFGYYLDPQTGRFRLFAAGAKWSKENRKTSTLNPGAFVEQPGPPDRHRSGDLLRDIERRGWMLDEKKQWHPIDTMSAGKAGELAAKHWRATADGWFSMGMGGMAYRPSSGQPVRLANRPLPPWLQARALDDLFRLPATIGPRALTDITRTSARLQCPLSGLDLTPGESATITVFHGPTDCLTFDHDLGYKEVKTRCWSNKIGPRPAIGGNNTVELTGLAPGAQYFLRVLVESPRGRIWSFETDPFQTPP